MVHFGENQLPDSASGFQFNRKPVGVIQFKRDFSAEPRVDPSGILDKQPHSSQRTAPFDKSGEIVRQSEKLFSCCEYKLSGQQQVGIRLDCMVTDFPVQS